MTQPKIGEVAAMEKVLPKKKDLHPHEDWVKINYRTHPEDEGYNQAIDKSRNAPLPPVRECAKLDANKLEEVVADAILKHFDGCTMPAKKYLEAYKVISDAVIDAEDVLLKWMTEDKG